MKLTLICVDFLIIKSCVTTSYLHMILCMLSYLLEMSFSTVGEIFNVNIKKRKK